MTGRRIFASATTRTGCGRPSARHSRQRTGSETARPATSARRRSCTVVASLADLGGIVGVRNPLPASGGVEPESAESVRRNAPEAFRTQERAVTPADYAEVTERHSGVQHAAATLRWTGSWHTVFITVDPEADADSRRVASRTSCHSSTAIAWRGTTSNSTIRSTCRSRSTCTCARSRTISAATSKRSLLDCSATACCATAAAACSIPTTSRSARPVYLSRLYAAAQAVPGVASVAHRHVSAPGHGHARPICNDGKLPLGRLEIARLDNDANYPERGVLRLEINGGK